MSRNWINSLRVVEVTTCVLLILLLSTLATAAPRGVSSDEKAFRAIRNQYEALKRNDPGIKNLNAWEDVAGRLRLLAEKNPASKRGPHIIWLLGDIYTETYRARSYRSALSKAVFYYEQLAKNYPGHPLVDDGLLILGDLRRTALGDETGARAAYYEIVDAYPKGDKVQTARERLGLSAKTKNAPAKNTTTVKHPEAAKKVETNEANKKSSSSGAAPIVVADSEARQSLHSGEKADVAGDMAAPADEIKDERGITHTLADLFGTKPESHQVYTDEVKIERPLVVIDPGHGGEDLGANSPNGVYEKDAVLHIALYLEEMLRERLRARTVLSRTTDVFISLPDRTKLANDHEANLFISIHANASPHGRASGIETYYLENTDNKASLKLAERENQSLRFGGGDRAQDLSLIFSDLIQNAKLDDSISLSHHIQRALVNRLGRSYRDIKNLGVKKAPFYVLVGAHMPCVLVEVGFLDHHVEGRRLEERRYQKLVAEALYFGVRSFFEPSKS